MLKLQNNQIKPNRQSIGLLLNVKYQNETEEDTLPYSFIMNIMDSSILDLAVKIMNSFWEKNLLKERKRGKVSNYV